MKTKNRIVIVGIGAGDDAIVIHHDLEKDISDDQR